MGGHFVLKTGAATVDALTHVLVELCCAAFVHCVSASGHVLCLGVACLVIRVGADGGRAVTLACDLSIVDGLGGLDVSMKGAQESGASGGGVKQRTPV